MRQNFLGARWLKLSLLIWGAWWSGCAWAEPPVISFGVVPQQSAKRLVQLWTPFLVQLSEMTELQLEFQTAPDIPTFEKRLLEGQYDIAYMNPYHYTVFHQRPGYQAFAREKNRKLQGIIVVRQDSLYQSTAELEGLTLVFPAKAAFAATILPLAYLKQQGWKGATQYVASHDSVYQNIASGLYPAGGGIQRTFESIKPEVRQQLRVLWKTPEYTPHAFAAHPRLSPIDLEKITNAMIALEESLEGQEVLGVLEFRGIQAAQDQEWDDVRGLRIDTLTELLQESR